MRTEKKQWGVQERDTTGEWIWAKDDAGKEILFLSYEEAMGFMEFHFGKELAAQKGGAKVTVRVWKAEV